MIGQRHVTSVVKETIKATPVKVCGRLLSCEILMLQHFLDNQLRDGSETVWQEQLGQLKNSTIPSGNEPPTFQLVA